MDTRILRDPKVLLCYPCFQHGKDRLLLRVMPEPFHGPQPLLIWKRAGGVYASTRYNIHKLIKPSELWEVKPTSLILHGFEGKARYCLDHRWPECLVSSGRIKPILTLEELETTKYEDRSTGYLERVVKA